jgi:hypothetical protein
MLYTIRQAKTNLSRLLDQACSGQEVIIAWQSADCQVDAHRGSTSKTGAREAFRENFVRARCVCASHRPGVVRSWVRALSASFGRPFVLGRRSGSLAGLFNAYSAAAWVNLMIAEAGASAALTGLVFVAVSINLEKVLAYPSLPGRAAESIIQLFGVLMITTLCLIPGQGPKLLGWELSVLGLLLWTVPSVVQARYLLQKRAEPWHWIGTRVMFNHLATLPVLAAGISLVVHAGGGLYWLVPGILFSFIAGIFHAWVLLIEILR